MAIEVVPEGVRGLIFESLPMGAVRVIKKMVFETADGSDISLMPLENPQIRRIAVVLHEIIFQAVRRVGVIPYIAIGIGGFRDVTTFSFLSVKVPHGEKSIPAAKIEEYFTHAVEDAYGVKSSWQAFPAGILANGYPVDMNILASRDGRTVKELTFPSVVMKFPPELAECFQGVISRWSGLAFECVPLEVPIHYTLTRALALNETLCVFLDRAYTLLILVQEGRLSFFVSFAYGSDEMARSIGRAKGISFQDARRRMIEYTQKVEMTPQEHAGMAEALLEAVETWKKRFLDALEWFYRYGPIPEDIIVSGDGARIYEVRAVLERTDWIHNYSSVQQPRIRIVGSQTLFEGNSLSGALHGPEDFALASLAAYSLQHQKVFENRLGMETLTLFL